MAEEIITEDKEKMLSDMMKAGLQYGHSRTRNNPKAGYYTIKTFKGVSFIDLEETIKGLEKALAYIKDTIASGKTIFFVGTRAGAKQRLKNLAEKYELPYSNERRLGGTLTNLKTLKKRIEYLQELEKDKKSDAWDKYTKKEKHDKEQELSQLERKFAGIKSVTSLPEVLFVIDPGLHQTALREARRLDIPVIAILDTDDNPEEIQHPIPANDSAKSAIDYILSKVDLAIAQGRKLVKEDTTKEKTKSEN